MKQILALSQCPFPTTITITPRALSLDNGEEHLNITD